MFRNSLFLLGMFLSNSYAQTTIYKEDFESGTAPTNWSLAGSSDFGANVWAVNNAYADAFGIAVVTPDQPLNIIGGPQSYYLHMSIAQFAGVVDNAVFDNSTASEANTTTSSINTLGKTNVGFKFWTLCEGFDGADYGQVFYSLDNGLTFTALPTTYHSNANWTEVVISATDVANVFDNQASLVFQFKWTNDGSGQGADPAWSIDEFEVFEENIVINYASTDPISRTSFCSPDTIVLGWTTSYTLNSGNMFQVELSDTLGDFPGTIISTFADTNKFGSSIINIPSGLTPSSLYQVRLVSTDPIITFSVLFDILTISNCSTSTISTSTISQSLNVYPNPFENTLKLNFTSQNNQNAKFEIRDLTGRILKSNEFEVKIGMQEKEIEMNELSSGVYILNVILGKEKFNLKVVKN